MRLKLILSAALLIAGAPAAKAGSAVTLSADGLNVSTMPFISHSGPQQFDNSLAMNLPYFPIKKLRCQLDRALGAKLDFYKAWNPEGEAHITVITPIEYWDVLRKHLTMPEIDAIALKNGLQKSDLKFEGIGSGKATLDGKPEETYFLIVQSKNLLAIRRAVNREFIKKGGDATAFSPDTFYPHITIGYTRRDLHITDGIIKDAAHSLDKRFDLFTNRP